MGREHLGVLRSRAIDGRAQFGRSLNDYARRGLLRKLADRAGVQLPNRSVVSDAKPLPAMLHRDRWVVRCPDCGTGAFVWLDEPLTMCAYCWNVKADGKWRRVALPDEATRVKVEQIVGRRPFPHQRCWIGQSLAALRRENVQNGDPIPTREG